MDLIHFLFLEVLLALSLQQGSDLTIDCEVFPTTTTTLIQFYIIYLTIQDPAEIMRQWTLLTYTNNYGFGDATTAVFVGGAMGTDAMLNPGVLQ